MTTHRQPRADWMYRSMLAGSCATAGMLGLFYTLYFLTVMGARWISPAGRDLQMVGNSGFFTSGLARNSLLALSHAGVWVGILAHACIGLALGMVYGRFVEPRLNGPGWRKGLLFAAPLWLASIIVFMPLMGIKITALTVGFSFLLHAAYGLLLGGLCGNTGDLRMSTDLQTAGDVRESKTMERGAARGILGGSALGLVLGGLLHFGMGAGQLGILGYSVGWVYAATIIFCGSMGFLIGMVTSTPPSSAAAA